MPTAAKRPCAQPGCKELVEKGKCPAHKRQEYQQEDRFRGSRHDRGYDAIWTKLRLTVLERDYYLCQPCARAGVHMPGSEVDHVLPKEDGGTDDEANLQTICRRCHGQKTGREEAARRRSAALGPRGGLDLGSDRQGTAPGPHLTRPQIKKLGFANCGSRSGHE